jgi:signal transduction histidine kinase
MKKAATKFIVLVLMFGMSLIECGVQLVVQDDGRGFDAATPHQNKADRGGFGLFSVRERVQNLGGRLEIQSSPGRGTEIRIFMPVLEDEKQDAGLASRI